MPKALTLFALSLMLAVSGVGQVWGQATGSSNCDSNQDQDSQAVSNASAAVGQQKAMASNSIVSKFGASNIAQAAQSDSHQQQIKSLSGSSDPLGSFGTGLSGLLSSFIGKLLGSGGQASGLLSSITGGSGGGGSGNGCSMMPNVSQGLQGVLSGGGGGCSAPQQSNAASVPSTQVIPYDQVLPQ